MSKVETYLNENQLENLRKILDQSKMGLHLLFDHEQINEVFKKDFNEEQFFTVENLVSAQEDLIRVLQLKNTRDQKNYIASLSAEKYDRLIRTYFYIIENEIKNNKTQIH